MKKITVLFAIAAATIITSCGGTGTSTETVDSTSVLVDSVLVDSVLVDSSAVESLKVEEVK